MMLAALHDLTRGPGRALLEATVAIGFSEPVARAGLDAELAAWTEEGFSAVRAELNDDVAPSRVPSTVLVVAASTLPASTLRAVLMARLLGARVLLKPATGQAAIAEAIAAADPAVTVRAFGSTDRAAVDAAIAEADSIVVLGGDRTIQELRGRVPFDKGFAGYGHRLSAAWVTRMDDDAARVWPATCAPGTRPAASARRWPGSEATSRPRRRCSRRPWRRSSARCRWRCRPRSPRCATRCGPSPT
jgi:hypothetical protein